MATPRDYPLDRKCLMETLSYDPQTGEFRHKSGRIAGSVTKQGYRMLHVFGFHIFAHRLAWFYVNGEWPKSILDHINQNKLDNRIENLRESNFSLNALNVVKPKITNSLGVLGVYVDRGKYLARVNTRPNRIFIGRFDTIEEATAAYNKAKLELMGTK